MMELEAKLLSPANDLIKIYREDTFSFSIHLTNEDDTNFDLTDYTLTFMLRSGSDTPVISEDFACSVDPTDGVAFGELTSLITDVTIKTYDYYIRIENIDSPPLIHTIAKGKAKILRGMDID